MTDEHKQTPGEPSEQELWDLLKQPVESDDPKSRSRGHKFGKKQEKSAEAPEEPENIPEEPEQIPGEAAEAPGETEEIPGEPKEIPEGKTPVVTERRKKALVFYLAGLFGIAFLIVLGSLMMRGSSGGSAEDAARLQALETRVQSMETELGTLTEERNTLAEENKELTKTNEDLSMQVYNMERTLLEMAGTNEYIEGEATMSDAEAQLLSKKIPVGQMN